MKLSIFCQFGLKTPIHAPKIGVFGGFQAVLVTHTHAKVNSSVAVQLIQKIEQKQTDGRTRPIALPFPLTRSVY